MEDPDENTLLSALINKLNKHIDQVGYATNNKAIKVYHDALSYNSTHSKTNPLCLDDRSKKVIKKIIPRMITSRSILYKIVESKNPDHPDLRAMLKAKNEIPKLFSECDDAILLGLLNWKRNTHKRHLEDYEAFDENLSKDKSASLLSEIKDNQSKLEVSVADLKALALKQYNWWNPLEILKEGIHYLSKHYVFPIDHLTSSDSRDLCTGMLYFNPMHPKHNTDPELILDPEKEWHRWLVKKVTDRENILLRNLYIYLIKNNPQQVMKLSRPKIQTPNSTIPVGIFSEVTDSLASGFLAFSKANQINNLPNDPKTHEEQRIQEENQRKLAEEQKLKNEVENKKKMDEEIEQRAAELVKKLAEEKAKEDALRKKIEDEITQRFAAKAESEKKEKEENSFVSNLLKPTETPALKPLPAIPPKPIKQNDPTQNPMINKELGYEKNSPQENYEKLVNNVINKPDTQPQQ